MKQALPLAGSDKAILKSCAVLSKLDEESYAAVVQHSEMVDVAAGADAVSEGGESQCLYVVLSGLVDIIKKDGSGAEKVIESLASGDYFGTLGMLGMESGKSSITARVQEDARLVGIPAQVFWQHLASNRDNRSTFDKAILATCAPIAELEEETRKLLLDRIEYSEVKKGNDIITEGTAGDCFYILLEGSVDVFKDENGTAIKLVELHPGAYFGEQALLGKKDGLRSATVHATSDCRLASITADSFQELIAVSGSNLDRFEGDASKYVYREIVKSLGSFIATEFDEASGDVERLVFSKGEILVEEGDESTYALLILSGVARVYKEIDGESRDLSRMGTGQIFGELGVLNDEPRSASVIADTDMEVLQVYGDAFRRWHKTRPEVSGFFNSLSQVYRLPEGRQVSVFLGEVGGQKAVTSVVGSTTEGVVATRVLDQGVVVFTNTTADSYPGERSVMSFADGNIKRELRVIVKERKRGKIHRCIVYAVSAEGIESDLGTLYQHVMDFDEVETVALRRFERTGFLGGKAAKTDRLCPCLGLGAVELKKAIDELGNDYDVLQDNVGVGSICSGCERAVQTFLIDDRNERNTGGIAAEVSAMPMRGQRTADTPASLLTSNEAQLAALLARGIDPSLESVTREQVAVRLRATGVRDMDFFIDMLFPGVFTTYARASYATLALAVGRGMGFGTWREQEVAPRKLSKTLALKLVHSLFHIGRVGIVTILLILAFISLALNPQGAALVWGGFVAFLALAYVGLSLTPSGRFLRTLLVSGPARYYRALWRAFGDEEGVAKLRLNPFGQRATYIVRDEVLVDYILQHPNIYARSALVGYPPFASHSVLGGGSSGVWLGYRMLCEEYFAEGYREDLDAMRAVVRERIDTWEKKESVELLREIYRIIVELRARILLETSFDCFDENAPIDYSKLVDNVLGPGPLLFSDPSGKDTEILRRRALKAVRETTRNDTVGGILRDAWEKGEINEREACENAVLYVLAQAPTMGVFWTLYRTARDNQQDKLRGSRKEIVKAIKEELRLHAPVSSMFSREVLRDDMLGDIPVKAGSSVVMSPMYIHTNKQQWTSPYQHDPDRWTSTVGDGKEIVEPKTDPDDSNARPKPGPESDATARYMPFGGGSQACQGRWFAADEMLLVVDEILKNYDLEIIEDRGLLSKPLSEQVMLHVYNRPYNDVKMKPIKRN